MSTRCQEPSQVCIAISMMVAVLAAMGCGRAERPVPMYAVRVNPHCPATTGDSYYPAGIFDASSGPQNMQPRSARLSRLLEAMREPSLSCGELPDSYRFLWVHSFSNWQPTMVRVSRNGKQWVAVSVRLADAVGRREAERNEVTLTEEQSREVLASVDEFGVWRKSTFASDPNVMDGATWVVEGRRGTAYHAVLRVNADTPAFTELALVFLKVVGMDPGIIKRSE